jgi:hypothetical protein
MLKPKMTPGMAEPHIDTVVLGKATTAIMTSPIKAIKADKNSQTSTKISKSGFFVIENLSPAPVPIYSKVESG